MIYFNWVPYLRLALLGAAVLTLWLVIWPAKAHAVIQCGPHTRMTEVLRDKYLEAPRHNATQGKRMVEVYVSDKRGFTVLVTDVKGLACIVAAGQDWHDVEWKPGRKS